MKKSIIIGIIILVAILVIFVIYFYPSSPKISYDELVKNPYLCNIEADCKIFFSHCSCSNICINKNPPGVTDCAVECPEDITNLSIQNCACINNKCVPKFKNQQSENTDLNITPDCCTVEQKAEGYICIRCSGGPPVKPGKPYVGGGNWCVRQRPPNETFRGDPGFYCPQ